MAKYLLLILFALQLAYCKGENENTSPITPQAEYTEKNPGEWEDLEDEHVPIVDYEYMGGGKVKVLIRVDDSSKFNERHYIEKMGVFDQNKIDLAVKNSERPGMFQTEVTIEVPEENPKIKAFVKCNLHDLWTTPVFPEKKWYAFW